MGRAQSITTNHGRGRLWLALLVTLVCLIPIRLFVLSSYYISRDACVSSDFRPGTLLLVNQTRTPHEPGHLLVFSYVDSTHTRHIAPARLLGDRGVQEDSLTIRSCSDTLTIPRSAVRGQVISSLHLAL